MPAESTAEPVLHDLEDESLPIEDTMKDIQPVEEENTAEMPPTEGAFPTEVAQKVEDYLKANVGQEENAIDQEEKAVAQSKQALAAERQKLVEMQKSIEEHAAKIAASERELQRRMEVIEARKERINRVVEDLGEAQS
jgi:hypothetical protein